MDICHFQNHQLEPKHQKYKGRVVLRGDIAKDDSDAYAVFTEQGSSASQMTAAKVMEVFERLPDCAGQAADAVSAYTQNKMEDVPRLLKKSKVRVSRFLDASSTTQVAQIMVKRRRPLGSSRMKFVRSPACWPHVGETKLRRFYWLGKSTWLGMSVTSPKTRIILIGSRGWHKHWLEESRKRLLCGRNEWNLWISENQHHFLTTKIWDVLNVNVKRTRVLLANKEKCSTHESLLQQLKS